MATIINKRPVQSSKFDKFWLTSLNIVYPSDVYVGATIIKLNPYDGKHIITSNDKIFSYTDFNSQTINRDILELTQLILDESQRLHPECTGLTNFKVISHDPKKPTTAFFVYSDGSSKIIEDCFNYAKTDATFAHKINQLIVFVAKATGIEYIN